MENLSVFSAFFVLGEGGIGTVGVHKT